MARDNSKYLVIALAAVVALLSCLLAARYNTSASKAKLELDQERYNRMTAEESLEKVNSKASALENDLRTSEAKFKSLETLLKQTVTINDDLKSQINKVNQVKEALDKKMQEIQNVSIPAAPVTNAVTNSVGGQ